VAQILDAFGYARESEKLFRSAIDGLTDAEIYRSAFIARLALFESFFKRDAFGKAIRFCEETLDLLKMTKGIHAQISQVWQELLKAVRAGTPNISSGRGETVSRSTLDITCAPRTEFFRTPTLSLGVLCSER
jgi:hypothetical protein